MKIFQCQSCGQFVFFENTQCMLCGSTLGYLPDKTLLSVLRPNGDNHWQPVTTQASEKRYRMCHNYVSQGICNWMVPVEHENIWCLSCRLNHTIPDLTLANNKKIWFRLEAAKRRMLYGIIRLGLPIHSKQESPHNGLAFDFLANSAAMFREDQTVITGHMQGLITINIAEADDASREKHRQDMDEPYRTLLGHFRHEIGHYFWRPLIVDQQHLDLFRQIFGDERLDYNESMQRYYQHPQADWQNNFVSRYASSHPLEDWAETWAHYLHIIDTLETAAEFGIKVEPPASSASKLHAELDHDLYQTEDFDEIVRHWLPLTYAVNSINRSMGQPDLYPFVLSPAVINKLRWIHWVIHHHKKVVTNTS